MGGWSHRLVNGLISRVWRVGLIHGLYDRIASLLKVLSLGKCEFDHDNDEIPVVRNNLLAFPS